MTDGLMGKTGAGERGGTSKAGVVEDERVSEVGTISMQVWSVSKWVGSGGECVATLVGVMGPGVRSEVKVTGAEVGKAIGSHEEVAGTWSGKAIRVEVHGPVEDSGVDSSGIEFVVGDTMKGIMGGEIGGTGEDELWGSGEGRMPGN
jgi:hypothetical protein